MKLYMTIAYFVRRFDIELHNTLPEDIHVRRALMAVGTRRGRLQVYARVTKVVED